MISRFKFVVCWLWSLVFPPHYEWLKSVKEIKEWHQAYIPPTASDADADLILNYARDGVSFAEQSLKITEVKADLLMKFSMGITGALLVAINVYKLKMDFTPTLVCWAIGVTLSLLANLPAVVMAPDIRNALSLLEPDRKSHEQPELRIAAGLAYRAETFRAINLWKSRRCTGSTLAIIAGLVMLFWT